MDGIIFCLSVLVALSPANGGKTRFNGVCVEVHSLRHWCYLCIKAAAAVQGAVSKCLTCTKLEHNLINLVFTDGHIIHLKTFQYNNMTSVQQLVALLHTCSVSVLLTLTVLIMFSPA